MRHLAVTVLATVGLLVASGAHARKPATVGSLDAPETSVAAGEPVTGTVDEAIASYRAFLELSAPDDPLRARALRRLADLELERREERVMSGEPLDAQSPDPVALYGELLALWPDEPSNDGVMYQLARAQELVGDVDGALVTLDELVRRFPASPYAAEANFRRGETHFTARRFHDAEKAYAAVLAGTAPTPFREQSQYKHGWSLYRQSMYVEAATSFLAVLDGRLGDTADAESVLEAATRAERELLDDTLRVLSLSYANLPGDDPIADHLDQLEPRAYEHVLYARQGDLYLTQERYGDAAGVYNAFVERRPAHERAPHLQMRAIEAYEAGGFTARVLDAKRSFVEHYGLEAPYWAGRTAADAPDVLAQLKANVTDLARHHHAAAQRAAELAQDPTSEVVVSPHEDYALAIRWYRRFLAYFPTDADAPATHFLLAEIVYDSGDVATAATEYERAAYDYGEHERAAEAGYAALLAYDQAADLSPDPGPLREARVESGLRFVDAFPTHEHAPAVLTASAEALYAQGSLERAIDAATRIAALPGATAQHRTTGLVVTGHASFDLGRFADAEPAYRDALISLPVDDPMGEALTERLAATIYKQGEAARAGGDLLAAAAHFLRVAKATPTASIRANAEYDAAVALMTLGDHAGAVPVLEAFRADHPDHELGRDVTRRLADAYLSSDRPVEAAAEMIRISEDAGEPADVRRSALLDAADLYERGGQPGLALDTLTAYVAAWPEPREPAMEARLRLADMLGEAGDEAGRHQWLARIVEAHDAAGAEADDRSRTLAARASLELADPILRAYDAIELTVPLAASLANKRTRMEAALRAYERAASYRVSDVTTAATFRIGQIYYGLSQAIMDSERPTGLSPDELEQYDILLEEEAFPIEEKAIEIFEANVARAAEGVYDEWVRLSYARLAQLMPVRYPKVERSEQSVESIH